jgi:hypothetical protein
MATIFNPPAAIPVPEFDFRNQAKYREDEKKFIENLSAFCKRRKKGDLIGRIIQFQVADGYAQYMVAGLKPVELIHLPLLDGYQSEFADLMTAEKIKEMIERQDALERIFSKKS